MKLNLTFFTLSAGRSKGVFIAGVKSVLWLKVGLRGPTCLVGRLARVARRPSFMAAPTLGIGYPMHRPSLTH
jgi:hypothetical protein